MRRLAWFVTLACVGGCAVGPNFERPKAPNVGQYTSGVEPSTSVEADGRAQRFHKGEEVVADWWRLFGSAAADATVSQALAHNQSLEAARASLRRSKNALRAGYGVFFPQIDAQAGASYQQASLLRFGQNQPPADFALYTVSGSVSYLIDIWGGQRRQVESLGAQVEAQKYTLAGAEVTVCANVMNTLIARAGYRAQLEATREILNAETDQLRITQAQAEGGTVPFSNVLAIKTQIASTEALLPQLQLRIDEADDLLAVLAGVEPAASGAPEVRLDGLTLPADIPLSLPSRLVRQRPDILIAEALLHSANAQIGVATAAMLPNITLSATGGANNTSFDNLFAANGLFGSVGAGLTAPLFHGGTLWHQRKAAVDARDEALANYKQTVLTAFQQVADTLRALQRHAEALKAQKDAVDAAEQASRLIQTNYRAGVANYLQVIIANEQYIQAKIIYVQTVAQRLQDTVALYVALGGGWWNMPP